MVRPTRIGPEDDHRNAHQPRLTPGHASEGIAGHEQHHDGDGVGDAQGRSGVVHENERNHHRERGQEHQEKNAERRPANRPCSSARAPGGSGSCFNRWRIASSSAGCRTEATTGGNASAMRRCACCGSVALRTARKVIRSAALLGQAAHEIQHAVNDAPGQIAAQRADEHRADFVAARLGDAERAGEGEDHDQAEEHLGDAVVRFEHALGGFDGFVGHGVVSRLSAMFRSNAAFTARRGGNR